MNRILVLALVLPTLAACSESGLGNRALSGDVPGSAVATAELSADWSFTVREVTEAIPRFQGTVQAYVGDGELVFETELGLDGIALSVENIDPDAGQFCHPNGLIVDDECPVRSASPYIIFDSAPVLEIVLDGRSCVAPRDSSAIELRIDDEHHLLRARIVAPVICPGDEAKSFEIVLEPVELVKEEEDLGPVAPEPIVIDEDGNRVP
ncbi:MAG: hypothetical protein ACJAYU_001484 [Bradymonadia bacterium]|jgi:hypothetical protein